MSIAIEEIHNELLVLLEFFHKICVQNGINYSLHGGTLLGAIREKGFIAWDDDADVTMDRKNYDKFCQLMNETELPDEFAFVDEGRFPQFAMKREGHPVVWTDIFVYDFISENKLLQKIKMAGTRFFILTTRSLEDQKMSNMNGLYKGMNKVLMNLLVHGSQIIPFKTRIKHAKRFMKSFPGNRKYVHRSNDTRVGSSMIIPASINDQYETIDFLGKELMIISDYDTLLRSSYGSNYMTPKKDKPDKMHAITLKKEQDEIESFVVKRKVT